MKFTFSANWFFEFAGQRGAAEKPRSSRSTSAFGKTPALFPKTFAPIGAPTATSLTIIVAAVAAAFLVSSAATAVTWPLADGEDVVGEPIRDRLRNDQTLVDMARMHNIGHFEIRLANPGLDPWLPRPGAEVQIPQLHVLPDAPREGIVINLAERRLYYFASTWPDRDGPVVSTHPVGVGLVDRATPVTLTRITAKIDDPAWYPTPEVRAWYAREKNQILPAMVPAGPENPLGQHAMVLDGDGLLIHGTHRPDGVGMRVSQGCIRLYPEGIRNLIRQVPVGTPVRIISQYQKLGWRGGRLYLEVEPPEDHSPESITDELSASGPEHEGRDDRASEAPDNAPGAASGDVSREAGWQRLRTRIQAHADGRDGVEIDWQGARAVFDRADSVATVIATIVTGVTAAATTSDTSNAAEIE
ncbi:MAG: L,D-transpeptidase family protein [Wenzhouxiangellaceae bacterium]|nr:L,D-transpeptidase family protein [Wenzhouxiangellaceae bacterium]